MITPGNLKHITTKKLIKYSLILSLISILIQALIDIIVTLYTEWPYSTEKGFIYIIFTMFFFNVFTYFFIRYKNNKHRPHFLQVIIIAFIIQALTILLFLPTSEIIMWVFDYNSPLKINVHIDPIFYLYKLLIFAIGLPVITIGLIYLFDRITKRVNKTKTLYVFILVFTTILIGCNQQTEQNCKFPAQKSLAKSSKKFYYTFDSITNIKPSNYSLTALSDIINNKGAIWMKSWPKPFKIKDFQFTNKGVNSNKWINHGPDSSFLSLYKDVLYYSPDSSMCVDIYGYRLILEKKNNVLYGSFDVDTEVKIYDLVNNRTKVLLFVGPVAGYDDCIWLDKNTFLLLGWNSEFKEKEYFRPFISVNDIPNNMYQYYTLNCAQDKLNEHFFKKRFPMIKVDF